jgi:crotonobetainyl-CoA:carnitine CoA-transferase CaiB-like acyl-CoA transferase
VAGGDRRRVWLSVTGYGLTGPGADRVAFGDDAAVAGGLVVRDEHGPCFCADAVADPLTGLVGAARVLDALVAGRGEVVDLAMAGVAAQFAPRTATTALGRR